MGHIEYINKVINDERMYRKDKARAFWKINGHMLLDFLKKKEPNNSQKSMSKLTLDEFINVLEYEIKIIKNIKNQIKD